MSLSVKVTIPHWPAKNQSDGRIGCHANVSCVLFASFLMFGSPLYCRIESYSCKLAGHEKQLYKRFHSEAGAGPHDLQVLSAPQTALAVSPTGGYFTSQR